jgi:hypothetical protein
MIPCDLPAAMRAFLDGDGGLAAVEAIVSAPQAWVKCEALEAWVKCEALEASCPGVVARLVASGWGEAWDRPEYPAVTFTPYGAWAASVVIVEVGARQIPVWQRVDDPEGPVPSRPFHAGKVEREVLFSDLAPPSVRLPTIDVMIDEVTGEPVVLLGQTVAVDRRIRGKR